MKSKHFLWAILLVVLVNFAVFGGVWQNRSDDTDAAVILTEREIRPQRNYRFNSNREDSGVALQLRTNEFVANDWFDRAKLEKLGFNCDLSPDDQKAYRHYRKRPSKKVFVVLEYEGDAWRKFRKGLEEELIELAVEASREDAVPKSIRNRRREIEQKLNNSSRLFAIDVGKNPGRLRKRYDEPNRYIITPAEVGIRISYSGSKKDKKKQLTGRVRRILTRRIHVELDKRDALDFLESKEGRDKYKDRSGYGNQTSPRYKVLVQYGSHYEPWIGRIELLAAEESAVESDG